ncbi:TPA: hypothetical protein JAN03_14945 [Citrobacter freundii]|nr:hypothetical protein [Citrobacter freundii]
MNEKQILDGAVNVTIPSDFSRLSTTDIRRKFSADTLPEEVWGDMDKNVWIAFRCYAWPDTDNIAGIAEKERQKFIIFTPVLDSVKVNGKEVRRVSMTIPGQDGTEMKTIIQFQYLGRKLIISEFSVSEEYVEEYERTGLNILDSVHLTTRY